jgi:hypothetical protein
MLADLNSLTGDLRAVKISDVLFWLGQHLLLQVVTGVSEEHIVTIFRFYPEEVCRIFPRNMGENLQLGVYLEDGENTTAQMQNGKATYQQFASRYSPAKLNSSHHIDNPLKIRF